MAAFIRRFVESRGGRILDEGKLLATARRHTGQCVGTASGALVLSYRHLVNEVEMQACDWIAWTADASPAGGASGASSDCMATDAGCQASSVAGAGDGCCGAPCPPEDACCASSSGACAAEVPERLWDFISAPPGTSIMEPSAPPPPAGAPMHATAAEVLFEEMRMPPFYDLGSVVVVSPPWGPSYLVRRRPYLVVLRHPTDSSRGARLLQTSDLSLAVVAANGLVEHMGLVENSSVSMELYAAILRDPEIGRHLAEACQSAEVDANGGASASSTSSASAPAAASSTTAASSSAAASAPPAPEGGAADDCPICFSPIEPSEAAMRCSGDAGVHHYFHSHCMQEWIRQCRNGQGPTCPICRGGIQFHARRLDQFLSGAGSAGLAEEERNFFQHCAERLRGGDGGWGQSINWDNAKYWGGIAAAGGWGFMLGYCETRRGLRHDLIEMTMTREQYFAQMAGMVIGTIIRMISEHRKEENERKKREGRRTGDRRR